MLFGIAFFDNEGRASQTTTSQFSLGGEPNRKTRKNSARQKDWKYVQIQIQTGLSKLSNSFQSELKIHPVLEFFLTETSPPINSSLLTRRTKNVSNTMAGRARPLLPWLRD
jgi:hypothetical protein